MKTTITICWLSTATSGERKNNNNNNNRRPTSNNHHNRIVKMLVAWRWLIIALLLPQGAGAFLSADGGGGVGRRRLLVLVLRAANGEKLTTRNTAYKAETFRKRRKPAFPSKAYSLLKDEERLQHNFISFIDQSIFSEYSQSVRLVEPRLYARPEQFLKENLSVPPGVEDVAEPASCKCNLVIRLFQLSPLKLLLIVGPSFSLLFFLYLQFTGNWQLSLRGMDCPLALLWGPCPMRSFPL